MSFKVMGLAPSLFQNLFFQDEKTLKEAGVTRYYVDSNPGYPDRIEMRDLEVGETALLINFEHLPLDGPYRSSHAIFVKEGATKQFEIVDEIPDVMKSRTLSVRAFDSEQMMVDASLVSGANAAALFNKMLSNEKVSYLHVHNATRGCYSGLVTRADFKTDFKRTVT